MALTEQVSIDKIEVIENGIIQVREVTRVIKDGEQIAHTYRRWTLSPGQDVSDQAENVKAICAATWTPEVVAAYEELQAANM